MLQVGRIDALIFERSSVMSTLKDLKVYGVRYQKLIDSPGGLAIQRNGLVWSIRSQLESELHKAAMSHRLKKFLDFQQMPDAGVINFK